MTPNQKVREKGEKEKEGEGKKQGRGRKKEYRKEILPLIVIRNQLEKLIHNCPSEVKQSVKEII